ncbi:MAG: leucine-rich repeat protein [Firmicutes bacterium]|nr:leucine-rich repeat protein [Bacillota bacterium]
MKVFAGENHALFLTDNGDLYRVEQSAPYLLAQGVKSAAAGSAADIFMTQSGKVMKAFSKTRIKELAVPDQFMPQQVYAAGNQNYYLLFDQDGLALEFGAEKAVAWEEKCVLPEVYGEETLQQVRKCSKVFMTGRVYYEYVDRVVNNERELVKELEETFVQEYGPGNIKIEMDRVSCEYISGHGPEAEKELAVGESQMIRFTTSKITYSPRVLVKNVQANPTLGKADFYDRYYQGSCPVKKDQEIPEWIAALQGVKKVILPSVENYGYVVLLENGELRMYVGEDQFWKVIGDVQDVSDYPGTMIVALESNEILYGTWKSVAEETAKRFCLTQEKFSQEDIPEPEGRWIVPDRRDLEMEPDILSPGGMWLRKYAGTADYIILPKGITRIGKEAFADSELKEIKINKECVEIEEKAFYNCSSLQSVEMEQTCIQTIRFMAFCNCTALKSVRFPKNCRELDMDVFRGCSALEDIKLNIGLKEIAIGTFAYCRSLGEVEIPLMCQAIRKDAFQECTSLQRVICHEGLKKVEYHAFVDASELTEVVLPPTCAEVNVLAFEGCTKVRIIK